MYADEANSTLAASGLNVLEREMNNELRNLNIWYLVNKLSLNIVAKTEFMLIGTRQRLLLQGSKQMQIQIERKNINQVEKAKSLHGCSYRLQFNLEKPRTRRNF